MSKFKEIYKIENNDLIIFDEDVDIDLKSNLKIQKKSLYYEDKKLLAEVCYHKNLLHGPSIYFSKNRDILSKSWFSDFISTSINSREADKPVANIVGMDSSRNRNDE